MTHVAVDLPRPRSRARPRASRPARPPSRAAAVGVPGAPVHGRCRWPCQVAVDPSEPAGGRCRGQGLVEQPEQVGVDGVRASRVRRPAGSRRPGRRPAAAPRRWCRRAARGRTRPAPAGSSPRPPRPGPRPAAGRRGPPSRPRAGASATRRPARPVAASARRPSRPADRRRRARSDGDHPRTRPARASAVRTACASGDQPGHDERDGATAVGVHAAQPAAQPAPAGPRTSRSTGPGRRRRPGAGHGR